VSAITRGNKSYIHEKKWLEGEILSITKVTPISHMHDGIH